MSEYIKEYSIASSDSDTMLAITVNKMIKNGWQPLGGVAVVQPNSRTYSFSQAMVKIDFSQNNT